MKILRSKKGSDFFEMQWNRLKGIFIALFIFISAMAFFTELTTSEYFEKNYLALDLGLTTDTLIASPNNLIFHYDQNTKEFTFEIEENRIRVFKWYVTRIIGSIAESFFIRNPQLEILSYEVRPIFDYVESDDPQTVIPVNLLISKIRGTIGFYNARSEVIDSPGIEGLSVNIASKKVLEDNGRLSDEEGDQVYIIESTWNPSRLAATRPADIFGQSTCDWASENDISVGINANPFDEFYNPVGLAAGEGEAINYGGDFDGVFAVYENGEVDIVDLWDDIWEGDFREEVEDIQNRGLILAVSGGPVIVEDCRIQNENIIGERNYGPSQGTSIRERREFSGRKIPRTIIGINREENKFYFVVFENSSLTDAAFFLKEEVCGCGDSQCTMLNLDGNASSSLYVSDEQVLETFESEDSCTFSGSKYLGEEYSKQVANNIGIKNG